MEGEAPPRRSVAELAGRFKCSAPPHDAAGNDTEKPVRRRPPRSLQLPKTHGDDQEQPPGVTSPLPTKAKRNSALIEKLQANLALSPSAMLPSPKSPGFRLLPPAFPPASAPVTTSSTTTPTSPVIVSPLTEEEGPATFEAPPTVAEGSILMNINKSRARHSIRRRPPSRRHRTSSSGDEVSVASEGGDVSVSSPSELEDKTIGEEGKGGEEEKGGGGGGGGEVFTQEVKRDEAKDEEKDSSTCPEKNKSQEEDQSKTNPGDEDEEKKVGENGSMEEEKGDGSSSGKKEEAQEKISGDNQEEDSAAGAINTDRKEEETVQETTCQSSAR
ncbi:duboraya isoform X5 [Micropterus salmoides]|uniref:duboraya isoform X5 n=1 Tax=Micropterus salmoides TaxID=27706 RepID=UPI0018EA4C58|nr:duboraya isoform X5 [Micropterus salmoides]